jgi:hypothetical protein
MEGKQVVQKVNFFSLSLARSLLHFFSGEGEEDTDLFLMGRNFR